MAEIATLDFKVGPVTPNQVELFVKNIGAALVEQLMVEFKFDLGLVTRQVADAVEAAKQQNLINQTTASRVSLANVVTGPAGWSVWAMAERTDSLAVIRLLNDLDQNGNKLATPVKLDPNEQFTVRVPLTPPPQPTHVEIPYSHRYPNVNRGGKQVDGKLEMTTGGSETTPKVQFWVDHKTPTTIPAGTTVNIKWKIENGVSATLYGPLPGASTQMTLSSDEIATYKIKEGSLGIIAVGAATYILHAQVRGGSTNELVIKSVHIDISSVEQYAYLDVRPSIVLPNSMVEVNWAVWDAKQVWLWVGGDQLELQLTEQGPSERYQGSGIWRVNAPKEKGDVSAWIELLQDGHKYQAKNTLFKVVTWIQNSDFSGKAVGMAVTAPKLALITAEKLWLADVGHTDPSTAPDFKEVRLDTPPKAWRAIAAFDKGFVTLQQTKEDGLQLARYEVSGKPDGLPVSLGDEFRAVAKIPNAICDLAVLGERVYVVVDGSAAPGGSLRRAVSVTFKPQAQVREEPDLEQFARYRLFAFDHALDKALYTINRSSGRMFRLRENKDGELDPPAKAASAVKDGQSMIRKGLMVTVGRVLLVLGPSSCPDVDELEGIAMMKYSAPKNLPAAAPMQQDLVYNPQQNHWIPCGHGLDIEPTSVVAFRPGVSRRLWVVNPDHKVNTVGGAHEHLFAPEFESAFSPKTLPPYLLERNPRKKRKFTIVNQTGRSWVQMTEAYREAGLSGFSAAGPAEIVRLPETVGFKSSSVLEFFCNEADPVPMTLRFLTEPADGVLYDYMVEITLAGQGLTEITSVIKRLTRDRDHSGNITMVEVPGTRQQHAPNTDIKVQPAKQLVDGLMLTIRNRTSYSLIEKRPKARERDTRSVSSFATRIDWTYPGFLIYAHGAGELKFDIDLLLPHGLELSPATQPQTKCVRIDGERANGLILSATSFKEPNEYECEIQYKIVKELPNVVGVAGGQASNDGKALYLAAAPSVTATQAYVAKIDPNSLEITGTSGATPAKDLFTAPRGVGALKGYVVAMFGDNNVHAMDHSLKPINIFSVSDYTALTYMHTYDADSTIFFIAMKQEGAGQNVKYKYDYLQKFLYKPPQNQPDTMGNGWIEELDALAGFVTTNRVPGAPRWVSPTTPSPVAPLFSGVKFAICVEGGVMMCEPRPSTKWSEIRIEGAGREEAVAFDSQYALLYTAHAKPNGDGLVITRISYDNVQDKKSITLPGPVIDMATDTRPFTTPALRYRHYRAVSLAAPGSQDALFVTHGNTIYQLHNRDLTITRSATVDLPCRFIDVRLAKPPGSRYQTFSEPMECWMIWAVGATYKGDGTKVEQYKTKLYKIGFPYFEM
jgi:hypothetical protein